MNEPWKKLSTIQDLDALDDDLVVAGYRAGLRNAPDLTQTSQDYWHGFNNGQVDGHHAPISAEQSQLARNVSEIMFQRIFGVSH